MAKKAARKAATSMPRKTSVVKAMKPGVQPVNRANIEQVEQETMQRVNKTISALEMAIASWDAAKEKPEDLKPKFMRYGQLHEVLSRWQTKALRSLGKADYDERVQLLWEFVDLCKTYNLG